MIHLMEDQPKKQSAAADLSPMLASIGDIDSVRREAEDWAFEMKWDGIRALARVQPGDGDPQRQHRADQPQRPGDMTSTYPELGELTDCVDVDCVLDGEIVALGQAADRISGDSNAGWD